MSRDAQEVCACLLGVLGPAAVAASAALRFRPVLFPCSSFSHSVDRAAYDDELRCEGLASPHAGCNSAAAEALGLNAIAAECMRGLRRLLTARRALASI